MPGSSSQIRYPSLLHRLFGVWYRHFRVYTRNILSNGLPPFLEPLIFLAGIGFGIGRYVDSMNGYPYLLFLATGLPVSTAMFTAAFECSYGTYIRMEFDHVYDGMLAAPITVYDLLIGEILWAGTKGLFFSSAVILITSLFGLAPMPGSLVVPLVGLFTGLMFGSLSLVVTSFVADINHFNFYFTGFLSPMFFFSGIVFPLENLPTVLRWAAEIFPLTHSVRMVRVLTLGVAPAWLAVDVLFVVAFTGACTYYAVQRLTKRLIV